MFRASCACSPRRFQVSQLSFLGTFMGPQNNSRFYGSEPILLDITTYFLYITLQITTYCYILVLLHIATFFKHVATYDYMWLCIITYYYIFVLFLVYIPAKLDGIISSNQTLSLLFALLEHFSCRSCPATSTPGSPLCNQAQWPGENVMMIIW